LPLILLAVVAAVILVAAGRSGRASQIIRKIGRGLLPLIMLVVAIVFTIRGLWVADLLVLAALFYLGVDVVWGKRRAPLSPTRMDEACAILGVGASATRAEIDAAYRRLMLRAHPDRGGTTGLAARLNEARDLLLKKI
jgi:DnaJ-domain-containing protein 1